MSNQTKQQPEVVVQQLARQPVLVTGATGFIGQKLTKELLALGAHVRILVREQSNPQIVQELENAGAQVAYGDIVDRQSVTDAVRGAEFVFHLAALNDENDVSAEEFQAVNVTGTSNVFYAAEQYGVRRVVYCSTTGVHGEATNELVSEDSPFAPVDEYQRTKCEAEKIAQQFGQRKRLEVVIFRPATVWGEGDTRALKLFRGVARRTLPMIGTGEALSHWVYVDDVVNALLLGAASEAAIGQTYIIAGKKAVAVAELFELISHKAGVGPALVTLPVKPLYMLGAVTEMVCKVLKTQPPLSTRQVNFFTNSKSYSTAKAQRELGFTAQQNLAEEVSAVFDWYQGNGLL